MDRREAIKKLAAGSALAAGGSMVLSSRNVAYAASTPGTGLSGIPSESQPLPVAVTSNKKGIVISDSTLPSCGSGALSKRYSWRIDGFNFQGNNKFKLIIVERGTDTVIVRGTGTNSLWSTAHGAVELRKANKNDPAGKALKSGDFYDVTMMVEWQCSDAGSYVRAEYRFSTTYGSPLSEGAYQSYATLPVPG